MSSSREIVERLLASGMSKAEIAREVGRDSSVISQITSAKKPYANLAPTLGAIEEKRRGRSVEVPQAPRRLNAQGQQANVRRPTGRGRTVSVRSSGAIKGGAKSVANRLKRASDDGDRAAWTVVYPPGTNVGKSGGKSHQAAEFQGDNVAVFDATADDVQAFVDEAGGNVGKGITAWLVAQNRLESPSVTPLSIEIRTYHAT